MQFRKSIFALLSCLLVVPAGACNLGDIVTKGSTDRSVSLDIIDSTDGTPETGVVFNTSGIDLWYRREGAAVTSITEATLAALTTAHADGGFLAVANGTYRLDLPDAAFATGANYVDIGGTVTGMVVICTRVRLVDYSLEDSVRGTTGTAVPNAAAGASGGLLISGSNSGTTTLGALTVTGATTLTGNVSMAAGLNITQSSSNTAALVVTGNGTGNGATITSGSGATGTGLAVVAASTNGAAATFAGTGTGNGITSTGGTTGHGIAAVGGATSGNGIRATGTAGNSAALNLVGQGSAAGLLTTGGATGHGIAAVGGATSGSGISAIASTSGNGIVATGVGTTQAGIAATGGSTSSAGISATGGGTGSGILATSGSGSTGNGITATAASTNGNGISAAGVGTGAGTLNTAGATGVGMSLVGGATSGNPLGTTVTNPIGPVPMLGIQESGTLQSATATTAVLRSATTFTDDNPVCMNLEIIAGTGVGQSRNITDWVSSTDTATVSTWTTTPDSTSDYVVWGTACASGGGSGPTAAEIADAVLDEDMTAHQTQGSLGQAIGDPVADSDTIWALANTNLNATVSSRASQTSVDTIDDFVDTEVSAIKTKTDFLPSATAGASGGVFIAGTNAATTVTTSFTSTFTGNLTGSVASVSGAVGSVTGAVGSIGTNGITSSSLATSATDEIVDGVWDEPKSDHATANTYGSYLDASVSGVSTGGVSAGDIADAVWDEDATAHQTQGTFGQAIGDPVADSDTIWALANTNLNATVSSRSSQVSVDDVPTNAELATALGTADDATLSAIAALNDISAEDVWTFTIEDQGGGISARCSLAVILAGMMGDVSTTSGSSTFEDPSGTETRATTVVVSAGNRSATITCPTY